MKKQLKVLEKAGIMVNKNEIFYDRVFCDGVPRMNISSRIEIAPLGKRSDTWLELTNERGLALRTKTVDDIEVGCFASDKNRLKAINDLLKNAKGKSFYVSEPIIKDSKIRIKTGAEIRAEKALVKAQNAFETKKANDVLEKAGKKAEAKPRYRTVHYEIARERKDYVPDFSTVV